MQIKNVGSKLKEYTHLVDDFFQNSFVLNIAADLCADSSEQKVPKEAPAKLREAMNYSLLAGGKRIRPALCLSSAALFGLDPAKALSFACGIEMIHTYSLIHDDLPAMDNDDLRRGKPSNHKQFDEATAILAGDALLTDAFSLMAENKPELPAHLVLKALLAVSQAAGSAGMVGGQVLDMGYSGSAFGSDNLLGTGSGNLLDNGSGNGFGSASLAGLRQMHALKTGALIRASCVSGAILAGAQEADLSAIDKYSQALGLCFQITDDLLDVKGSTEQLGKPAGSDAAQGKLTYPALLGVEESERLAAQEADCAREQLSPYLGAEADFLRAFPLYILKRLA